MDDHQIGVVLSENFLECGVEALGVRYLFEFIEEKRPEFLTDMLNAAPDGKAVTRIMYMLRQRKYRDPAMFGRQGWEHEVVEPITYLTAMIEGASGYEPLGSGGFESSTEEEESSTEEESSQQQEMSSEEQEEEEEEEEEETQESLNNRINAWRRSISS